MAINTDVVVAYNFEEDGGSRYDSSGSGLTLTDNNTCPRVDGNPGYAVNMTAANSEYLSASHDAKFQIGSGDWQGVVWVKKLEDTTAANVFAKYRDPSSKEYILIRITETTYRWLVYTGTGSTSIYIDTDDIVFMNTWRMISVRYVNSTDKIGISVDNGAWKDSTGTGTPALFNYAFTIGCRLGSSGNPAYYTSQSEAQLVFRKGSLWTDAELTAIYNGGAGQAYPYTMGTVFKPLIHLF